jgi:hypothetical protein
MIRRIIYAFVSCAALCLILSIVLDPKKPSQPIVLQEMITKCLMTTGTDEEFEKCVLHAAVSLRTTPARRVRPGRRPDAYVLTL